jgi:hypothetical protein
MNLQKAERCVRVDFTKGKKIVFSFFTDVRTLKAKSTFFKNMIEGEKDSKIYKANIPHPKADLNQLVCYLKTGIMYCSGSANSFAEYLEGFGALWVNAEYLGLEGVIEHLKGTFLKSMTCIANGEDSSVNLFEIPSFLECMTDQNIEELLKHLQKKMPNLIRQIPFQVALGQFLKKRQKFELSYAQRLFLESSSKPFLQISVEQNTSVLKPPCEREQRPRQRVLIPPELRHFMQIHNLLPLNAGMQTAEVDDSINEQVQMMQQAFAEMLNELHNEAVENPE